MAKKNKSRIKHAEDLIIDQGNEGVNKLANFFAAATLSAAASIVSKVTPLRYLSTLKWDGSPGIRTGIDEEDGKFFIEPRTLYGRYQK